MGREGQGRADKSKESKYFKATSVRLNVPGKFYLQCTVSGVPALPSVKVLVHLGK